MHFWNKTSFDGLAALEKQLGASPQLEKLAEYCRLRGMGLRRQALSSLDEFLQAAIGLVDADRRQAVISILEAHVRTPGAHQFLATPLLDQLVLPTLKSWLEEEPNSQAARWLGLLQRNASLLQRAIELAPDDLPSRRALINLILSNVEYATHHLGEGLFIGEPDDARAALAEARSLIASAPSKSQLADLVGECDELSSLMADWLLYCESPLGAFSEWCSARGRRYGFPTVVYFGGKG